jgi:NagD protein
MDAGMETILVLSGVTRAAGIERYPYRPTRVLPSVAAIPVD